MKNNLFSLLFFASFSSAIAQPINSQTDWHRGSLILRSGLEMNGEIYFDQVTELVQFKSQAMIKAFSSHQVQSFQFVEESFGILRKFVAYDFNARSHYARKEFFEVVLKGPITVLRRHHNLHEIIANPTDEQTNGQPDTFNYSKDFAYYVQVQHQFIDLRKFRKEILPLMNRDFDQEISQLVKEKHLSLYLLDHQIRLVNYYNFLKAQQTDNTLANQGIVITP